ncbi:MAG: hypothetical protein QXO67_02735 [Candidatus Bathyarchaeia archaeon]
MSKRFVEKRLTHWLFRDLPPKKVELGFAPPVFVSFTLTQPSVSQWSLPAGKAYTDVEDLVVGLWDRLTEKGMGICKIDIHPDYAPASPHTAENITGWHIHVFPCWVREALPLSALHDEVDRQVSAL